MGLDDWERYPKVISLLFTQIQSPVRYFGKCLLTSVDSKGAL